MPVAPQLQSLWLADEVLPDQQTGKVAVRGLFNVIEIDAPSVEFRSRSFLFFSLRGVRGTADFRLCYVDLSTLEVLRDRPVRVVSGGPLSVTDVCVHIASMPVPHPGVYAWELHYEGQMIGSSRLTAIVNPQLGGASVERPRLC